jgi:cytochrome c oxidase assembly factor CtaG
MTTFQFFVSAWTWNPVLLFLCAAAGAAYLAAFGWRGRIGYFLGAVAVVLLALVSPINALAGGYLFSAHMVQHILLLLIAPALMLLSLPRTFRVTGRWRAFLHPVFGWFGGVGAMWLWHAPALCNAAVSSRPIYALQSGSLLVLGSLFWWQVLAPRDQDRLMPLAGVGYLFTACTACSVLGIILTFSPVTVCAIYQQPIDRLGILSTIRNHWGMNHENDQQIGGLLMWVPMCLIYLSAIFAQLVRWFSPPLSVVTNSIPEKA